MKRSIYEPEHELFIDSLRSFVAGEVAPHFDDWEKAGIVERSLLVKAAEMGLLGLQIPEEYGGGGAGEDYRYEAALNEVFGRSGYLNAGLGIISHQLPVGYIRRLGTEEQLARWLPPMASGECIGAIAMTEPGTGSDLAAIATRARRVEGGYVLNGSKLFISNGIHSDLVVVVARTADGAKNHLSLLVVERGMAGFTKGRNLDKIGQHCADTAELFFDDVHVPEANRLGDEGAAFLYLMQNLPVERLTIAVAAVAQAQAAFDWTLAYVKDRKAFGQPIGTFQNSRFAMATMRTELDIAQTYVDQQTRDYLAGELSAEDASKAKWWTTDLLRRVLDQCLQLHGGYGYMEEYPIARAWRDGRAMSIYGGTNEIMKEYIGRRELGL